MPTLRTKTVKTSGGDYTTLAAWQAGEQANLVTLDEIRRAECYSRVDVTGLYTGGFATDATRYLHIYVPPAERHRGKWDATKFYAVGTDIFFYLTSFMHLEGLQFEVVATGAFNAAVQLSSDAETGAELRISQCLVLQSSGANTAFGFYHVKAGGTLKCWNNILDGLNSAGISIDNAAGGTLYSSNNTVVNSAKGFWRLTAGVHVAKNNLTKSCTDGFNGTFDAASTNNCSDIASDAPGNSPRTGSVSFVDVANDDYHLSPSDTVAKGYGADLRADPNTPFEDDNDGTARAIPWDIGAHQSALSRFRNTSQSIRVGPGMGCVERL